MHVKKALNSTLLFELSIARTLHNSHNFSYYVNVRVLENSPPSHSSGYMFMGDVFDSALFKQTFQRVFSKDANDEFKTAYNASFEVKVLFAIPLAIGFVNLSHFLRNSLFFEKSSLFNFFYIDDISVGNKIELVVFTHDSIDTLC